MLLWMILAAMTAAAVAMVLRPLWRGSRPVGAADASLVAVYRDQLAEIDSEIAEGIVSSEEGAAARLEIQRRLLRQADAGSGDVAGSAVDTRSRRRSSFAVMALVPVASVVLYALLGSPHLRDQPLSQRRAAAPDKAQIEILIARVEERLRTHPEDGQGWDVIAPVYARQGRAQDALNAWRQAIRLQGSSPARLRGLSEASISTGQGVVDAEAREALEALQKSNPADPIPRFWLAIAKEQNGKRAEAAADLEALLKSAPPEAPWRAAVAERLAEMAREGRVGSEKEAGQTAANPSVSAVPGPSAAQVDAARQMSDEDRNRMIGGMVDGLAARLAKDGSDADGWLRLINAYSVLGRKADASAALDRARRALASDSAALSRLAALGKTLGL